MPTSFQHPRFTCHLSSVAPVLSFLRYLPTAVVLAVGSLFFLTGLVASTASAQEHASSNHPLGDVLGGSVDPIGSPHPLPWAWMMEIQNRTVSSDTPYLFYYRSPALMSPQGTHTAYSRMQVQRVADPTQTQVSSVLFLENTQTGELQFLAASSPQMQHVLLQGTDSQQPGMLSMLLPISWSESGDRVLIRAFESIFSTDIAADYAIIWEQASNHVEQVIPTDIHYSNAILLGWSQTHPEHLLFKVGNLGDELWPLLSMGADGISTVAIADQPITYGQQTVTFWNGPQASAID